MSLSPQIIRGLCVRSSRLSAPGCSMQGSGWRMGRSPVSLSRLKLGKLKVVRRQLLQRYEHQPFVSCLAGLYGCQWRRYQRAKAQPGECCCSRVRSLIHYSFHCYAISSCESRLKQQQNAKLFVLHSKFDWWWVKSCCDICKPQHNLTTFHV